MMDEKQNSDIKTILKMEISEFNKLPEEEKKKILDKLQEAYDEIRQKYKELMSLEGNKATGRPRKVYNVPEKERKAIEQRRHNAKQYYYRRKAIKNLDQKTI